MFGFANGLAHRSFLRYLEISYWYFDPVNPVTQRSAKSNFVQIFRCWIVYGRRWLIMIPSIILFLASAATGIWFANLVNKPSTHEGLTLHISEGTRWAIAFYAVTVTQNVLSTGKPLQRKSEGVQLTYLLNRPLDFTHLDR
jgi:hypothetical protein